MTASVEFRGPWGSRRVDCAAGQPLLFEGLRSLLPLPYECASGSCGRCRATLIEGAVQDLWPGAPALGTAARGERDILLCQSSAGSDSCVEVAFSGPGVEDEGRHAPTSIGGTVASLNDLGGDLWRLRVRTDAPFVFLPGQFCMIAAPAVEGFRAYSMASFPALPNAADFVVRRQAGGMMSSWLHGADSIGTRVRLFGPLGRAHLRPDVDRDLVLIVGGSGVGVASSVLDWAGRTDPAAVPRLSVFVGLRSGAAEGVIASLEEASSQLRNRAHVCLALSDPNEAGPALRSVELRSGLVGDVACASLQPGDRAKTFLVAGPPAMVKATLRQLLTTLKASPRQVRYDSFS